jgi:hypothetical protein
VNEHGFDGDIPGFTDGRDLPFLQDLDTDSNGVSDVWYDSWEITYRDVVVTDANNEPVGTLNVTSSSLADADNYAALRSLFTDNIAPNSTPDSIWQNPIEPLQVNTDGFIGPLDALLVINALSEYPDGQLPNSISGEAPYLDPSGDGILTPVDPLIIINYLNNQSSSAGLTAPLSAAAEMGTSESAVATFTTNLNSATPNREMTVDAMMAEFDSSSQPPTTPLLPPARISAEQLELQDPFRADRVHQDEQEQDENADERWSQHVLSVQL